MAHQRSRISRRRKIKSCQYCYIHKLKCDHGTPCQTCTSQQVEDQCIYNFQNGKHAKEPHSHKVVNTKYKLVNISKDDFFKSRAFYPLFSSTLTDKLVFPSLYDSTALNPKFTRNPITSLSKLHRSTPITDIDEVISLIPKKLNDSLAQLTTFECSIHPVIPILSIKECEAALAELYKQLKHSQVDINNCLLLFSILFCASYANLASGALLNTQACTDYYRAYNFILKQSDFPRYPNRKALETYVLVNFTLDPNMVDATNFSPMLVRMAQQLGLHKLDSHQDTHSNKLHVLWHFLLYIDGSSSVVNGFPFSTRSNILDEIPIPIKYVDPNPSVPIEFTIGRFYINKSFRIVMDLASQSNICSKNEKNTDENVINSVAKIIIKLCKSMENRLSEDSGDYFSSTLYVFLYRLHSRYILLTSNGLPNDKVLRSESPNNEKLSNVVGDVSWILDKPQEFNKKVVILSLLILIQTLRRLTQKNIQNFDWYTKGSTVMQYLFVLLKNLYQNSSFVIDLEDNFPDYVHTLNDDVLMSLEKEPFHFQIVLLDTLMDLLEFKLAPLWNNFDLFQFSLIKNIKEETWKKLSKIKADSQENILKLRSEILMFKLADELLVERNSIYLEDCLQLWENDADFLQYSQNFAQWLTEL
ncbi:ancestral locus [Nakaseomyces bracarensis]|uniref:Ancestral locus n=1 Tax=Nakaseomyces bracarensis TaxID=273131 RepID=A0ABR4NPI0_9SACH